MPKTKISEYSTTNADNTDIEGINIAEGCAPSGINNAIREVMVHLKEFQTGASGDGFTFAGGVLISGTTNTISGNVIMSGNLNSSGTNTFSGATVISNTLSGVTQLNVDNLRLDGNTLSSTDTNGNVSISPNGNGSVVVSSAGTSDALRITQTGSGNALLVEDSTNPDATPFVVQADGTVLSGQTVASAYVGGVNAALQASEATGGYAIGVNRFSADTSGANVVFRKSRATTATGNDVVSSGDTLGIIRFAGTDGTAAIEAARIQSAVDGTPGTNDMPGRLVFSTTADGASSPTERMRISNAGFVGIATTSPGSALDVKGTLRLSGSSSGYVGIAPAAAAGSTTYTLPSADGTSGQVLSTNGSGTLSWASGGSSQWTTTGSDIYYTTGKVGVGVSTFTANGGKLEVSDGVTFPATQSACSNANTLDDYEEGTWTPTSANVTFSSATGYYTKIGRVVQFACWITFPSTADVNTAVIGGLPFTCANADAARAGTAVSYCEYTTAVTAGVNKNSTNIFIYKFSGTTPTNADFSSKIVAIGGTYVV